MDRGAVETDRSRWPICVYRLQREATDADLRCYFREALKDLATKQVTFAIVEYGPFTPVSARQRQLLAEFSRDNAHLARNYRYSMAIVVKSALMRGVLTAIFWFQRPGATHVEVFDTFDEALRWSEARQREFENQSRAS